MFRTIYMALIAAMLVFNYSCKKDESDPPANNPTPITPENPAANLKKLGETYIAGAAAKAIVYADKDLQTGYNAIYVMFYDSLSNTLLTDGHCELETEMTMSAMTHASPVESPESPKPDKGLYKGAAVFQMASGSMGSWKLFIHYHNHKNDQEGEGELAITVGTPSVARIATLSASDSTILLVSLVKPATTKEGLNDFEILINKKETMMSFPAITDYTVEITPEMPSMGHGSPDNVNPVHTANGHYTGKVNLTMNGLWRIHIKLKKNNVVMHDQFYFDITL